MLELCLDSYYGKYRVLLDVLRAIDLYANRIVERLTDIIGYAKPSMEFFSEAFKIIGCKDTNRILIVGDSIASDMTVIEFMIV